MAINKIDFNRDEGDGGATSGQVDRIREVLGINADVAIIDDLNLAITSRLAVHEAATFGGVHPASAIELTDFGGYNNVQTALTALYAHIDPLGVNYTHKAVAISLDLNGTELILKPYTDATNLNTALSELFSGVEFVENSLANHLSQAVSHPSSSVTLSNINGLGSNNVQDAMVILYQRISLLDSEYTLSESLVSSSSANIDRLITSLDSLEADLPALTLNVNTLQAEYNTLASDIEALGNFAALNPIRPLHSDATINIYEGDSSLPGYNGTNPASQLIEALKAFDYIAPGVTLTIKFKSYSGPAAYGKFVFPTPFRLSDYIPSGPGTVVIRGEVTPADQWSAPLTHLYAGSDITTGRTKGSIFEISGKTSANLILTDLAFIGSESTSGFIPAAALLRVTKGASATLHTPMTFLGGSTQLMVDMNSSVRLHPSKLEDSTHALLQFLFLANAQTGIDVAFNSFVHFNSLKTPTASPCVFNTNGLTGTFGAIATAKYMSMLLSDYVFRTTDFWTARVYNTFAQSQIVGVTTDPITQL